MCVCLPRHLCFSVFVDNIHIIFMTGGYIAMRLAARSPKEVAGLCLLAPAGRYGVLHPLSFNVPLVGLDPIAAVVGQQTFRYTQSHTHMHTQFLSLTHTRTHTHTHTHIHTHTCTNTNSNTHKHKLEHAQTHTIHTSTRQTGWVSSSSSGVLANLYVGILKSQHYMYIYVCTYTYEYIYIYIYIYIHMYVN